MNKHIGQLTKNARTKNLIKNEKTSTEMRCFMTIFYVFCWNQSAKAGLYSSCHNAFTVNSTLVEFSAAANSFLNIKVCSGSTLLNKPVSFELKF